MEGCGHAERRQAERAPVRRDERAEGVARALGLARVAAQVAVEHARRQVGAAQLDVEARLGREPVARKLELAANKKSADTLGIGLVVRFDSKNQKSRSGRIMYSTSVTPERCVREAFGEQYAGLPASVMQ